MGVSSHRRKGVRPQIFLKMLPPTNCSKQNKMSTAVQAGGHFWTLWLWLVWLQSFRRLKLFDSDGLRLFAAAWGSLQKPLKQLPARNAFYHCCMDSLEERLDSEQLDECCSPVSGLKGVNLLAQPRELKPQLRHGRPRQNSMQ